MLGGNGISDEYLIYNGDFINKLKLKCTTLGISEFIRFPRPPAKIIVVKLIINIIKVLVFVFILIAIKNKCANVQNISYLLCVFYSVYSVFMCFKMFIVLKSVN